MRLENRTALITGAASGIGKAIALRFAEEGARIVIADRTDAPREGGRKTLDQIEMMGGEAVFVRTDVADWTSVDAAVSLAVEKYGTLDVMVNNAAIGVNKPILETTEEDWENVMGVNARGVFFGCKRAIQQMISQPERDGVRGRIVNIASQHGMIRSPDNFAYGTGKAAVVYMTRQVAGDYAAEGIVCNAVAPGKILTGKSGPAIDPAVLAHAQMRTPWSRLGLPRDVANAVLFLASDEATFITGENLMVDGGWMAN